jgi:hypothetical protein
MNYCQMVRGNLCRMNTPVDRYGELWSANGGCADIKSGENYRIRSWETPASHSQKWRRSWFGGFVSAVTYRLREARNEAVEEAEALASQSNALIHLRDKQALVEKWITDGGIKEGPGSRASTDWSAHTAGRKVGESVALASNALEAK